jgi:hypothetical protein
MTRKPIVFFFFAQFFGPLAIVAATTSIPLNHELSGNHLRVRTSELNVNIELQKILHKILKGQLVPFK